MNFVSFAVTQLTLFLPAYFSNMCPGFARGWNWPGDVPISEKWLGAHKTWRGHYASIIGALVMAFTLHVVTALFGSYVANDAYWNHWFALGLLMGIGAKGGDDVKSLIKRARGIAPGEKWPPFDQADYILGAIVCAMPITGWLGFPAYLVVIAPTLLFHGICARIAFKNGQKSVPH